MSALRQFVTASAIYAVTGAMVSAVPLLLIPVLTRELNPEQYGLAAIHLLCVALLTHFCGLGLNGAVNVRFFDKTTDFSRFVAACVSIIAGATALSFTVILLLSPWLSPLVQLDAKWLALAGLAAGANAIILIRLAIWQARQQPIAFGSLRLFQAATDILLTLMFVSALAYGWEGRASAVTIAYVLCALVAAGLLIRDGYLGKAPDRSTVRSALAFGLPLVPHLIGGFFLLMADRLIVANVAGMEAAGIYMVAAQVGVALNLITTSVNRAFAPWLLKNLALSDKDRDRKIVAFTYTYLAGLLILSAAFAIVCVIALPIVADSSYAAAIPLVPYIVAGSFFTGAYYMVTNYIFFRSRTGLLSTSTIIIGLLNLLLSYVLITAFGMIGAAYSFATAQAVLFAATWIIAHRVHPMPWGDPDFSYFAFKRHRN